MKRGSGRKMSDLVRPSRFGITLSKDRQSRDHALHSTFTAFKAKPQRLMSWEDYHDYEVIVSDNNLSSDPTLDSTSKRTWFTHETVIAPNDIRVTGADLRPSPTCHWWQT